MKIIRLVGEDYTRYMKNLDGFKHQMKKALWDAHGNVRITGPSGRFIGIVRQDPGNADTSAREEVVHEASDQQMNAQADAMKRMRLSGHVKSAPSPRSCKCAAWPWPEKQGPRPLDDRGKPAAHHPKCAYCKMWERQKGHSIKNVAAGPTLEPTIHKAGKVVNHNVTRGRLEGHPNKAAPLKEKTEKIPHPDVCPKCKDFTKSRRMEQDQHHPTCVYFKKYKAITAARAALGRPTPAPEPAMPSKKNPVFLINLDTQEVVRKAEPEEIEEGRRRLRDEGTAFVHVDGDDYLLAFEDGSSLEPAEPDTQAAAADTEPPGPRSDEEEYTDAEGEAEAEKAEAEAKGAAALEALAGE